MATRHGSHTSFEVRLHIAWVTKYRKKLMTEPIAQRVRDIVREESRKQDVEIMKGHVSKDHVHVFVSIPPNVTMSRYVWGPAYQTGVTI